jgi:preprotein translocase subunit SecE
MRAGAGGGRPVISRVSGYIREVISELRKVVWPTREEARRLTIMVIIIAGVIGLFLGAIDLGFTRLVDLFFGG